MYREADEEIAKAIRLLGIRHGACLFLTGLGQDRLLQFFRLESARALVARPRDLSVFAYQIEPVRMSGVVGTSLVIDFVQ